MISPAGEQLYLPPSLRYFVPLGADAGDPEPHACFEYDVVEAKRPEMLVDLGAGNALSFAVFCQSMKDHTVDGLAYAIDIWEEDKQREREGAIPLTTINNFLRTHFRGLAYLLKLGPEQALSHFADRSIDLLRIDLDRTERPFVALLDAWAPKLRPGAVLLLAGVNARANVLTKLVDRSPLVFPSGRGLAAMVHEMPAAGTDVHPLLQIISRETAANELDLIRFYEHAALHHSLKNEILGHADVLYRKRPT